MSHYRNGVNKKVIKYLETTKAEPLISIQPLLAIS